MPAVNSIRNVVESAIQRASNATGVDFTFLMGTAKRESGFNPGAKARTTSSAVGVVLGVVLLVVPGCDFIHPCLVFEVPIHGVGQTFVKGDAGFPAESVLQVRGVDGVAQVVAGAILHEGDQFFM